MCVDNESSNIICNIPKSAIQELQVKCMHVVKGCNWKGTIDTLKNHLSKCEWAEVPIPELAEGEFFCEECEERHKQDQPYLYCQRKAYKDDRKKHGLCNDFVSLL